MEVEVAVEDMRDHGKGDGSGNGHVIGGVTAPRYPDAVAHTRRRVSDKDGLLADFFAGGVCWWGVLASLYSILGASASQNPHFCVIKALPSFLHRVSLSAFRITRPFLEPKSILYFLASTRPIPAQHFYVQYSPIIV
jgi:hypothetical protein